MDVKVDGDTETAAYAAEVNVDVYGVVDIEVLKW